MENGKGGVIGNVMKLVLGEKNIIEFETCMIL